MDLQSFKGRYFRNWDKEDLPSDNTFDKYQIPYFSEKEYDVEVRDGQLNIEFEGENWACSRLGHRGLSRGEGGGGAEVPRLREGAPPLPLRQRVQARAAAADRRGAQTDRGGEGRGFIAFHRDWMKDVNVNDRPLPGETSRSCRLGVRRGI